MSRTAVAEPEPAASADPEVVAAAVAACPHVVGLRSAPASGVGAEVATYLPGGRVDGVRVSGSVVAVRVVGALGQNLTEFADEVRTAVRTAAPRATTVDVFIDDLLAADDLSRKG
nr:hypothetical protein [Micromonospora sp. DSM 115978]